MASQPILATTMDIDADRFSVIEPESITKLVRMKDQKFLRENGGVEGILAALETDSENGILGDENDIKSRRVAFGSNLYPQDKPTKTIYRFLLKAAKDPMIIVLLSCVMLSLCFAIEKHGLKQGAHEGVTKLVAILIVVAVSAGSDYWPHRVCQKLSDDSSYITKVDVVRKGVWQRISICRVVVGDIVFLKPGDQVPADGLFLNGCLLIVEKLKNDGQIELVKVDGHENPFLASNNRVLDGYAKVLVTAVGIKKWSHVIRLEGVLVNEFVNLTSVIGKVGRAASFVVLLILLARFFAGNKASSGKKILDVLADFVGIVATPAMIALTAAPEGLLLAVRVSLAYSMQKMMGKDVLLRKPSLCHALGSVTTVCANITGSLTMDKKEVTKCWLGLSSIEEVPHNLITPNILELLHQGIGLNTTQPFSNSSLKSPQNPTEKAIFDWSVKHMGMNIELLKRNCTILEIEPFNSENKLSGVLISRSADNTIHVHRKGAPEVILPLCSHYYETSGTVKVISKSARALLEQILDDMAGSGLCCIAFAHRKTSIRDYFTFSRQQLILLGFVGLTSWRQSGVKKALEDCQKAGVKIKLMTGDNLSTAKAMAIDCGILEDHSNQNPGELAEGEKFRNYTPEERMEKAGNIVVMARASPFDKFLMVQSLKQEGHVVAVMGRGIGDVQALREADVGICFGTEGADFAKACSDIVVLDKNPVSILNILSWGRGINDNIQMYTQFLLTAGFVSLLMDFVSAILSSKPPNIDAVEEVSTGSDPYPTFQLMWVKVMMGTLATLALIIRQPHEDLMRKQPKSRIEPLINGTIRRNIIVQAFYQVTMLLTIHFWGKSIFNVNDKVKDALAVNSYILCQFFNLFMVRRFEKNIMDEIRRGRLFWGIAGIVIGIHVLMMEVLMKYEGSAVLDWRQWGVCVVVAAVTWPVSEVVKFTCGLEMRPDFISKIWRKLKSKIE